MGQARAHLTRTLRGSVNSAATYSELTPGYLRERISPFRNAAKRLARVLHISPRTAENYLAAEHAPSGEVFLNMLAAFPDFADTVMENVKERRKHMSFGERVMRCDEITAMIMAEVERRKIES